ncbi:AAA family ATPase [Endozoicomonas sp. 8E]|uniref:AAA family ATPase n=1 Tax=Endozoicomonas sp. 8E TaxID=3035692 RepID=UPI0029395160|nr:AAA family ATPase [Endozoicomonas sp. 8E]WOG28841.1 AAA family ATPase [Endozoicomonas sp. 8E]
MDGQIAGGTKKRVPDRSLPDYGVAAKRVKLDLSSKEKKDVEINSAVRPKLKRSPSSEMLPDKARTVSSTDSLIPKIANAFDFRFVASDNEVRQLLIARTCDEHQDVAVISHPDHLSQSNLLSRLSISEEGRHTLSSGKLFEGSQPFTLVIDIRKLTSEELPKLNDLLDPDNPCLYDKVSQEKRPLGQHVSLLVLADPAQLASVGRRDDAVGAPGADFWRRINRPENTWQFNAQTGNDPSMEIDKVPPLLTELPSAESAMDDDNSVLIDCHLHSNWRQLLLGGPGVDKQGRIQHLPGRLETLRGGQRVILKGADWEDLAFEQTIRQMLTQKCFESNGKICPLHDDVQFYQMPVGKDELHSLFQSLFHSRVKKGVNKDSAPRTPIIINESNISEWLSPIAIAPEGYAVPDNCLLEQIRAGGAVTVTSPLTEVLWFRLLGSLQTIRETTGLEPELQVAYSRRQPDALGLAETDDYPLSKLQEKMSKHLAFRAVTYQQPGQASRWINNQRHAPLVIQINEQTGFSQLFDNIHITSEQKAHFGRSQSKLQEALTAGRPVVLRGLETNPTLQRLLEPLVVGQPLLVNGQLQAYPKAHITLLWPKAARSPSSLVNSMVAMGKRCRRVDLWDINAHKHDIPRTELPEQSLNELYKAFKTVPADLCNPLPEITEGLLHNLIMAARRAQQVDQSPQLLPRHWRKAINSLITHGTRQNPSVRDFMKVACWHFLPDKTTNAHEKPDEIQIASVDPDRLNDILTSAPRLDTAFVEQNLWPLVRAFDPGVLNEQLELSYESPLPLRDKEKEEVLGRFCAMIVAHGPEHQRQAMAHQLAVDPVSTEPCQSLAIRPSRQIKRLQDALASGWQLPLPSGQTRSNAIQSLASDCFRIARTANSDAAGVEHIENRLSESLKWTDTADDTLSALARDLYHGKISQKDRESRRLSRLHERLTDSPVIFLQGETGTGKSYFSAKMARASGQASVISLGPSDSEQTLMKRWQWRQHADGDRSMVQQNRALMEWAKTESNKNQGYITLVLDEANLAKAGLLASLNGLWEPQPCIYVNGHPVKVSPKHRVILTGNPDHYAGRQMDPALKEKLPRAYYPRLDQAFLRDRVVEPALANHLQRHLPEQQINDIAHSVTKSVMALWQYYQELLPDHEFTPRDLTDICSWVGWYLDRAQPARGSVTCEQIHSLIQQSFRDVLGPEITETHQDALSALEIWFTARYQPENTLSDRVYNKTLSDIQQTFSTVATEIRPDFDTSGSAVRELAQRLGQDLNRCQQAYHRNIKHGGRQATLVEGPAGRGKDTTLNLVIESVRQQAEKRQELMPEVFTLNACDYSWDKVCEAIQKAKIKGGIVVISEMNLIDSQHLEGELNDILAGEAHPGFHLFATINPPEYSGRKPLSPALKGRFRHLPIRQYNPAELQTIAEKVLPESSQGTFVAKKLTEKHCRLRAYLQQTNLPLQPTSLDLQNVARAVNRGGDFSDKALHQCLNQYYRLYLMAAKLSLEELPKSLAPAMGKGSLDPELSEWFYQRVSGIDRPWLIRRSDRSAIDEKHHEICFMAHPTKEEAKTEIIKEVAQARWQASGLSLKPDASNDILIRALYRYWQQCWFKHEFAHTGVDANSLFPMTEEEEQALKMPDSQPCLREVDQRISTWTSSAVQFRPEFWHQIIDLPNHRAGHNINKALAVGDDITPEKYNPEVLEKQAPALDRRTNYLVLTTPDPEGHIVFDTDKNISHMYRCSALDVYVTSEGNIKLIDLKDIHIWGVETLIPDRLPGPDQTLTLASDQTLGTRELSSDNGQYALPSLKPNDYIVALRVEPDLPFTLVRDPYTGLHTLSVPEAKVGQRIRVVYVVEPREPGKATHARQTSTDLDTHCSEGMKTVLDRVFTTIDQQRRAKVRELLQTIKDAKDTKQRIKAIKKYCQQFSGKAKPKRSANFFEFLVTRQQGNCRHRAPVFVALCRYFGIPCRQVASFVHNFAEYSGDGGQTWKSVDLGGEPGETEEATTDFQPSIKITDSSNKSKKTKALLKDFLKGADLAQQQTLAKACGISLEELNKAHETNSVFPRVNLSISKIVRNLWEENNLTSFSMGVSLLMSLETKEWSWEEVDLICITIKNKRIVSGPMSQAVRKILSNNDEDLITEQLKLLHSKFIVQAGTSAFIWLSSVVDILKDSDLTKPSVIHFASEAVKSTWLDLPSDYQYMHNVEINDYHQLLVSLEAVHELKVKATRYLKKWYETYLSREKDSWIWLLAYASFQEEIGSTMLVTHDHDGFSPFLKGEIACLSLQSSWSDEPEGIPNIERMLVHQPAFRKLSSGNANHRPVIILGQPSWDNTVIKEKAEALFQRKVENSPDLKLLLEKIKLKSFKVSSKYQRRLDNLRDKYQQAIQQAFSHYLYGVTHSKGGSLTYCWAEAQWWNSKSENYYGAHEPSSPQELFDMMSGINSSLSFQNAVKDAYLKQAHNASNALLLKSRELTKIADEFLNTVNLNSLYESLDT